MKVQMKIGISGTRNGVDWPAIGGVVDVTKGEAERLIANGFAVPVEVKRSAVEPEKAVAPTPETATSKGGLTKASTGF